MNKIQLMHYLARLQKIEGMRVMASAAIRFIDVKTVGYSLVEHGFDKRLRDLYREFSNSINWNKYVDDIRNPESGMINHKVYAETMTTRENGIWLITILDSLELGKFDCSESGEYMLRAQALNMNGLLYRKYEAFAKIYVKWQALNGTENFMHYLIREYPLVVERRENLIKGAKLGRDEIDDAMYESNKAELRELSMSLMGWQLAYLIFCVNMENFITGDKLWN